MHAMDNSGMPKTTRTVARPATTTRRQMLGLAAAAWAWPGLARAAHVVRPWPVDKPTPGLALTDLDGKTWTLAALQGKVVVLNFWASWCEPCRAEMPSLERLAARHARDALIVLAVNYLEAPTVIKGFLALQPVSLPILLDLEGDACAAWTPRVFPTTVLVDRSGTPRTQVLGELDWLSAEARALIGPMLARPKAA